MLRLTFLFLFLVLLSIAGCDSNEPEEEPEPTPTTGSITGRISLPPGASGSVENTRVAIYSSYDDWASDRVLRSVGASSGGNYTINNVTPGTYYLDAWKDNNNSQTWDRGDFVGVYGSGAYPNYTLSPFQVSAGQTTVVNLEVIVVP